MLIAMASSGLHANGYSLVRRALFSDGMLLDTTPARLDGRTLGDELLTPTRIYTQDCLALLAAFGVTGVHGFCHVTGGGLAANLERVLPAGLDAEVERGDVDAAGCLRPGAEAGPVALPDLELALNLGVGMIAVVAAAHGGRRARPAGRPRGRGLAARPDASPGSGRTRMLGDYAR